MASRSRSPSIAVELVDQNRCGEAPPPGVDGLPRIGSSSALRAGIDGPLSSQKLIVGAQNRPGLPASPLGRSMSDSARSFPFLLLFGPFLLYVQEGSAASVQVDMQIEAAARLKSTVSDLPDLDISRNISFGPPRPYLHV